MGTEETNREDSLAPVSVERLSVEEEVALMERGKGGQALKAVVVLACIAAGGAFWLQGMDEAKVYSDVVSATAQLQEQQADAFVHCALQGTHASQLREGAKLAAAVEAASERMPARYATTLRRCAKKLTALAEGLDTLAIPAELGAQGDAARAAAGKLETAALSYAEALSEMDVQKDAHPSAAALGEAWAAFGDESTTLSEAARQHL